MSNELVEAVWTLKIGEKAETFKLGKIKEVAKKAFSDESDSYKQKLIFALLEATQSKDQNRFFYLLLHAINKPKEKFKELCEELEKKYDILPEEAFIILAYSIIIGIMSTYRGEKYGERN